MNNDSTGETVRMRVAHLLDQARARFTDAPTAESLRAARQRMDAPLRVAIAGKVKAGKSTLLNALVGEALAPTDAGECTRIVTWYRDGQTYKVMLHPVDGAPVQAPFHRADDALVVRLEGRTPSDVDRLVVHWPSASLRALTLIDTPGIDSLSTDVSARTHGFLAPEDRPGQADAICYLMRHLHATDARFLEAFSDDRAARATPMNAIGVLSRADEVGVGRLHALATADRIASRYRADTRVRRLCQTVLPVAGLLAQSGATLREDEYAALSAIAGLDRAVTLDLLLSADRFVADRDDLGVDGGTRRALVDRFGLYGVRVGLALIRSGQARGATQLATEFVRRSGVAALREALATQFTARADLLKARSGLAALTSVLDTHPGPTSDELAGEVEQIVAGTHAFAEARALNALRAGTVPIGDAQAVEAERLLGGHGAAPACRLGVAIDVAGPPDSDALRAAASAALTRWATRAEHPFAPRPAIELAGVVVRSCEGLVTGLGQPSIT